MASGSTDPLALTRPFALTPTIRREPYEALSPYIASNQHQGKVILITGAGTGIGAAAARVWASAKVAGIALVGRNESKLNETAKSVTKLVSDVDVLPVSADLVDDDAVKGMFEIVKQHFGHSPDILLSCAGGNVQTLKVGEKGTAEWWTDFEINTRGLYSLTHHWINSQSDPMNPSGSLMYLTGGLEGLAQPGLSSISTSKLAAHRLIEYVHLEYPNIRTFAILPGLVHTAGTTDWMLPYAQDHPDMTGLLALWLASERSDFMRGKLVSVNWDIKELEAHKEGLVNMQGITPFPVLPVNGGSVLK